MQFRYFPVENLFQFWQAFYSWASTVSLTGEWWTSFNTKPEAQQHRFAISLYTLSKYFSYGKSAWNFPFEKKSIHQQDSEETMGNLYPARGSDRDCVVFVKQVHFSYSESPWTPPIEWTSLHWRTYSVDLEPVYDLHPITNSPCQRLWHRHNVSSFFFSFLLIFAFLFFIFFLHFFILLHFFFFFFFFFSGHFSYGESPRTPPLEGTSLHRRNNSVERPWGILSLFITCFQLRVN